MFPPLYAITDTAKVFWPGWKTVQPKEVDPRHLFLSHAIGISLLLSTPQQWSPAHRLTRSRTRYAAYFTPRITQHSNNHSSLDPHLHLQLRPNPLPPLRRSSQPSLLRIDHPHPPPTPPALRLSARPSHYPRVLPPERQAVHTVSVLRLPLYRRSRQARRRR